MARTFKQILALAAASLPVIAAGGCFDSETSPFSSDDWAYCQKIPSDSHEMYLYYTPLNDTVLLGFHSLQDTDGWTALGINGNGGMKGATFVVVRQDDDGTFVAEDRYAMDYEMPTMDEQQDVKLLFAEQDENGQTAWGVAIPQNSCDEAGNDYEILSRSTDILWAVGSSHDFSYHSKRGQFQANLIEPPQEPASTDGLSSIELRMPNVTVIMGEGGEDESNPYICSYFDLNEIANEGGFTPEDTIYATRFSPVLNPDSKHYVHHMILYSCDADMEYGNQIGHLQLIPECTAMPEGCLEMKWPWAVGGKDFVFPDNVGLPVDGGGSRFLVLQMHYYNKYLDEGVVDDSGVKIYFTTEPKEQEAAVLTLVGAVNSWQRGPLPAGRERVSISFATPSECTQNWTEPLNILGVGHHEHIRGVRQQINVVRDGANLGALRPEYYYDFKHQNMGAPVPKLSQLLPGDQITQVCDYDTSSDAEDVEFGDYTHQEMCYTAIYYYPRQETNEFGAMPIWFDANICSQPANTTDFLALNLSLCAESVFSNVPAFFGFEDQVPMPFDLLTVCNNAALFGELLTEIPYLCPETGCAGETCTAEEIAMYAAGMCDNFCNDVGVSQYPNISNTEPYEYGNWACDPSYYSVPSIPDAPACQAKGIDTLKSIEVSDIVLKDVSTSAATTNDSKDATSDETTDSTGEVEANPTETENNDNSASSKIPLVPASFLVFSSIIIALAVF